MNNQLFDQQNLTVVKNVASEEYFTNEIKSKQALFADESCDGFFETLQRQIRNEEYLYERPLEIPDCKLVLKSMNLLGEYFPIDHHIKYYKQTPNSLEIVKIHERFHAIHHLMLDDNGAIWNDFCWIDSFHLELLAQLFTFIYIRDFEPSLMVEFESLNRSQPFIYKTYKIFSHFDQSKAEELYWIIRTKNDQHPYSRLFNEIGKRLRNKKIDDAVFNGIRKTINKFREQPFMFFTEEDIWASLSKDMTDRNSDVLIFGNSFAQPKIMKTNLLFSLVHLAYPMQFTPESIYSEKSNLHHCIDNQSYNGSNEICDLAVLNPDYIENFFNSHSEDDQVSEFLKQVYKRDLDKSQLKHTDEELLFAIDITYIQMVKAKSFDSVGEIQGTNDKLEFAIDQGHCKRAIQLIFCSNYQEADYILNSSRNIYKYNISSFKNKRIINLFIESYIDCNNIKRTSKPVYKGYENVWSDLLNIINCHEL